MLEDFLSYIESNLSVIREDKILLAISGGIDSMVMLHLFRQLGFDIVVAHINHSTRNGQSDDDLAFVEAHCKEISVPFYSKTLDYQSLQKGNFQENARKARFSFLTEVQENQNCKWIATAHHKDDRWETFLMHLNRKSGIKGLTSLRAKNQQVIHPLLIFNKNQIVQYGNDHSVKFVHDASNDKDDYQRNAIRHRVTPEIIKLFPDFIENVNQSIGHLDKTSLLLREFIDHHEFITNDSKTNYSTIELDKIKAFHNKLELLYLILEGFGFNYGNAKEILDTSNTGARFESQKYEALFDRGTLIIRKKRNVESINLTIEGPGSYQLSKGKKLLVQLDSSSKNEAHLFLDASKISWPLTIRSIRAGDKIKPKGMKGATKSLKKLCTDLKINRFVKEDLLVVCKEDTILQVIGIRSRYDYTTADIKNALTFSIVD